MEKVNRKDYCLSFLNFMKSVKIRRYFTNKLKQNKAPRQ